MMSEVVGAKVGVEQPIPEPGRVLEKQCRRPACGLPPFAAIPIRPILQPAAGDGVPIAADEREQIFALHEEILPPKPWSS